MKGFLLASSLLLGLSGLWGCGGDDDDDGGGGGGAGCAHAQMVCASTDPDAIDCDEWDKAPASVKDCASKATTCDAVLNCVLMASGGG